MMVEWKVGRTRPVQSAARAAFAAQGSAVQRWAWAAVLLLLPFWVPIARGQAASFDAGAMRTATQTALGVVSEPRREGHGPAQAASAHPRLRAQVTSVDGSEMAGGVVVFRAGEAALGAAVVDANGIAELTADTLPLGDAQVVAVFTGDNTHSGSVSDARQVHAEASGLADYTLAATPASLTTPAGGFVTTVVTVTPVNGFTGYVSLSCSGLPAVATCTFNPVSVLASGAAVNSTLQIQTAAPSTSASNPGRPGLPLYALAFPGVLGLLGFGVRRGRRGRDAALAITMLAGMAGLNACSQRYSYLHHPPAPNPGTPLGTSTVTVNALASNGSQVTTHTFQLTLTVTAAK